MLLELLLALAPLQTCDTPVAAVPFGSGTLGSAGVPRLNNAGAPVLDGPYYVYVSDAGSGLQGLVGLSFAQGSTPLPGVGGDLLLGGAPIVAPFQVDDLGTSPPLFPLVVPQAFCGLQVFAQALLIDPAAAGSLALTRGLALTFGVDRGPLFSGEQFGQTAGTDDIDCVDLDGDGDLDWLISTLDLGFSFDPSPVGGLEALLNDGDGRFTESVSFGADVVRAVAAGDLDGNGEVDLVTAAGVGLQVYFGEPGPAWGAAVGFLTEGATNDVQVADLDQDGDLDVVVAIDDSNAVQVFVGDGQGGLTAQPPLPVGGFPQKVFAVDLDQDGLVDLFTVDRFDALSGLKGLGGGAFAAAQTISMGDLPTPLDARFEDLNGDGLRDIAVLGVLSTVSVRLQTASGGFAPPVLYPLGAQPIELEVLDLDADGVLDLVASLQFDDGVVYLTGRGDGTFDPAQTLASAGDTSALSAGDLDGDGTADLVVGSYFEGGAAAFVDFEASFVRYPGEVALGGGDGGGPAVRGFFDAGGSPDVLAVAAENQGASTLSLLRGAPEGFFQAPEVYSVPYLVESLDSGDLDGDGDLDAVAAGGSASSQLQVLRNDGSGQFVVEGIYSPLEWIEEVALGDLDGDGLEECVALFHNGRLEVLELDVPQQIQVAWTTALFGPSGRPRQLLLDDLNGDGALDLLARYEPDAVNGRIVFAFGNGDGTFGGPTELPEYFGVDAVDVGDVDGDGTLDLAFTQISPESLSVALGDGRGGFALLWSVPISDRSRSLALRDLNGDGREDVVFATTNSIQVMRNEGGGVLGDAERFVAPAPAASRRAIGDLSGDGTPDLVWVRQGMLRIRHSLLLD